MLDKKREKILKELSTNKVNNSQNLIQEPQMTESQILPNSNIQQDANLRFSNDIQKRQQTSLQTFRLY